MKVLVERYGDAAFAALAGELDAAKEGDPLRRAHGGGRPAATSA